MNLEKQLQARQVHTSAPCRVDLGGTLDISTIFLALNHLAPSSFNIALDMRTKVSLFPWKKDYIKVSSKGFKPCVFNKQDSLFHHPMGLIFASAAYFDAHGVHVKIESGSPPRSALGGSSSAAVAVIAAFYKAVDRPMDPGHIAWLAHYIEASVAGVPCGMQDQLAAAFGGVNQWFWKMGRICPEYEKKPVFENENDIKALNSNILVAYCGIPHVSKDINEQWIKSFVRGETRSVFQKIAMLTDQFSKAVQNKEFKKAGRLMNQETQLRLEMTPDVLDETGKILFKKALDCDCGARFAGAGGGGCVWAIGEAQDIKNLKPLWLDTLKDVKDAQMLDTKIENKGIMIH